MQTLSIAELSDGRRTLLFKEFNGQELTGGAAIVTVAPPPPALILMARLADEAAKRALENSRRDLGPDQ